MAEAFSLLVQPHLDPMPVQACVSWGSTRRQEGEGKGLNKGMGSKGGCLACVREEQLRTAYRHAMRRPGTWG